MSQVPYQLRYAARQILVENSQNAKDIFFFLKVGQQFYVWQMDIGQASKADLRMSIQFQTDEILL